MSKYMVLEIGKACFTQLRGPDNSFFTTDDAVWVDSVEADSKQEAIDIVTKTAKRLNISGEFKPDFDNLMAVQIVSQEILDEIILAITYLEDGANNSAIDVLERLKTRCVDVVNCKN